MLKLLVQVVGIVVLGFLLADGIERLSRALRGIEAAHTLATNPTSPVPSGPDAAALAFKPRPLTDYAETVDRPLFFEGRRYPEPAKPAAPPPLAAAPPPPPVRISAEGIKLYGIVLASGQARALVEAPPAMVAWISVGDAVQAWTVQAIRPNSVRLTTADGRQFATLSLYGGADEKSGE